MIYLPFLKITYEVLTVCRDKKITRKWLPEEYNLIEGIFYLKASLPVIWEKAILALWNYVPGYGLTQISMNITRALASALHYKILLLWLAVFSLNYVSSIQCLETFNMAATQELLRKMLKAFMHIS